MCTSKSLYNTLAYKNCDQECVYLLHKRKVYYYCKTTSIFKCYKINVTKIGFTTFPSIIIILSQNYCCYQIAYYTSGFRINLRPNLM